MSEAAQPLLLSQTTQTYDAANRLTRLSALAFTPKTPPPPIPEELSALPTRLRQWLHLVEEDEIEGQVLQSHIRLAPPN